MKKKFILFLLVLSVVVRGGLFPAYSASAGKLPKTKNTPTPTQSPVYPTPTRVPNLDLIRGVNYNPIIIGTYQLDSTAPATDISNIKSMGANTIGTYNAGLFEWGDLSNVGASLGFYTNLADLADSQGLKVIVGYFSNQTMDWTDPARVAKATSQFQQLVNDTKSRPSTAMYLIGNELFEVLPSDSARQSYAKWVGDMVTWTHSQGQNLKVTYADNHIFTAMPWLKMYAPNLDIYSLNTYEWSSVSELTSIIDKVATLWPNKSVLLHEWGVDSLDYSTRSENQSAQATRISELASIIATVAQSRPQLLGSLYFEYSDQWDKAGLPGTQDTQPAVWKCTTCFDGVANEDYWGLRSNTALKSAYYSLKNAWK